MSKELDASGREEVVAARVRIEMAYEILSSIWNTSTTRDVREATGQDEMGPMMKLLHAQRDHVCKSLGR